MSRRSLRCDGIEGRRSRWIVYRPGTDDAEATAAAEPPGSHSYRDSRRRVCPKGGEPLFAPVPARDPRHVQVGGTGHECKGGALRRSILLGGLFGLYGWESEITR